MTIIFAGVILGLILAFFLLAWSASMVVLLIPVILLIIVAIQTFFKIRDRNVDN